MIEMKRKKKKKKKKKKKRFVETVMAKETEGVLKIGDGIMGNGTMGSGRKDV